MPTPPAIVSRSNSRRARPEQRHDGCRARPTADKRDSSPLRTLATLGLLAGQAAVGAALPLREASAHGIALRSPEQKRPPASRMQQGADEAYQIARRALEQGSQGHTPGYFDDAWLVLQADAEARRGDTPERLAPPAPGRAYRARFEGADNVVMQAPDGGVYINTPPAARPSPQLSPQSQTPRYTPPPQQMPIQQERMAALPQPGAAIPGDSSIFNGIPAAQNAIALIWRGDYDAIFHVYANNGPYQPGLGAPFKTVQVKAGQYNIVELPEAFSGRVQLMSGEAGHADDAATWAEITFDAWQQLTFFDISAIRGLNAGLSMRASDGSQNAAIPADILSRAPDSLKVKDSGGRMVIKDTEGYDGSLRQDAIDWLHDQFSLSDAYVRNFEDTSTKATHDKHMVFEFSA